MNTAVMFSSNKDDWETPQEFFDPLHAEFDFQMDMAANPKNAKCPVFYHKGNSALENDWHVEAAHVTRGWCNPPYSKGLQGKFIAKAAAERKSGFLTVMLLPARTDTIAFHTHIYDAKRRRARTGVEIRFIKGRIKFVGADHGAPFPSMVVVFRP